MKEIEAKASEIVDNFKGATVDHFGCCLMQEQIVKALKQTRLEAYEQGKAERYLLKAEIEQARNNALEDAAKVVLAQEKERWTTRTVRSLIEIAEEIRTLAKKECYGKD